MNENLENQKNNCNYVLRPYICYAKENIDLALDPEIKVPLQEKLDEILNDIDSFTQTLEQIDVILAKLGYK